MAGRRIVVFTKLFWPEGGGAELATYLIVKDILSKHIDVIVASGTEKPKADVLKCCKYIHWPVLKTRYKPVEWLKLFANTRIIRKLIGQADVVYILSHTLLPLAIIAKIVKPAVKVVVHLHNYQPLTYTSVVLAGREPDLATDIVVEHGEHNSTIRAILAGIGHYVNVLSKLALYYADKVICVSRRQLEILAKHIPILRDKTVVVYNPPPPVPNIGKRPSAEPTILYIGGGSFVKGFHIAVRVFARVLTKFNCRVYVTYGRSISLQQKLLLEKLTSKLGSKLVVLGRIPYEELLKLHECVWGTLFPSLWEEPLPYAVVETCLLGTIPVAARVSGVPEIVEGTFAEKLLFRPADINDVLEKVKIVLSMTRKELINLGHELSEKTREKFNAEKVRENLLKVFL